MQFFSLNKVVLYNNKIVVTAIANLGFWKDVNFVYTRWRQLHLFININFTFPFVWINNKWSFKFVAEDFCKIIQFPVNKILKYLYYTLWKRTL